MLLLHDLAARLLPSPLQVETLTLEDHGLTLDVKVPTPTAPCPTCAQSATRIHSDYRRTLGAIKQKYANRHRAYQYVAESKR